MNEELPTNQSTAPVVIRSKKSILKWSVVGLISIGIIIALVYLIILTNGQKTSPQNNVAQNTTEVKALTFYHWWTSPSESSALKALVGVFTKNNPDVAVVAAPIVGGAGFKMLTTIKTLIAVGQGPDAFQMHAGYEAQPFFDAGLLSPIDYIWSSENLEKFIPKVIQDMNKFDGKYYSIPVDVHRSNVVWYNKTLLDKYNIDPSKLTTWDAFFNVADTLKAKGIKYPIVMGENWTASQVFETIIAGSGISFYEDWINGRVTTVNDPRLIAALTTFKKYLSYINPDSANVTWDEAIGRVIKGESVFNNMGDWANGEFKLVGMKYGKEYGSFLMPGTQDMYGLVIDTFQHPKNVSHPVSSDEWLKTVSSKEGQDNFNPIKGSISVRSDSDMSKYDTYQQAAIESFKNAKYLYPSVAHGSGAPEDFKIKLNEFMVAFVQNQDVAKTAADIANYTKSIISQYKKVWTLQ